MTASLYQSGSSRKESATGPRPLREVWAQEQVPCRVRSLAPRRRSIVGESFWQAAFQDLRGIAAVLETGARARRSVALVWVLLRLRRMSGQTAAEAGSSATSPMLAEGDTCWRVGQAPRAAAL